MILNHCSRPEIPKAGRIPTETGVKIQVVLKRIWTIMDKSKGDIGCIKKEPEYYVLITLSFICEILLF